MTRRVPLRAIAHARAGDKGNRSNVAVFVYHPKHYPAIAAQLTPERLKAEFGSLLRGPIRRFEVEHLGALNFVMDEAPGRRGQRILEPRLARQVLELPAPRPRGRGRRLIRPGLTQRLRSMGLCGF